jgi:hypothetical protein
MTTEGLGSSGSEGLQDERVSQIESICRIYMGLRPVEGIEKWERG